MMPRTLAKSCCSPAGSGDGRRAGRIPVLQGGDDKPRSRTLSKRPPVPQLTAFGGRVAGECAQLAEDLSRFLGAPAVPREFFGRGPALRDNLDVLRFRECISKAGRNRDNTRLFAFGGGAFADWLHELVARAGSENLAHVARLTGVSPFASTNWSRP